MKVLISFIGKNDAGSLIDKEEGTILTILSERKFDKIILLYNNPTIDNENISYADIAEYLKKTIIKKNYIIEDKIKIKEFDCDQIADHTAVYKFLISILQSMETDLLNAELFAGISSGTPAMQTAWILIAEANTYPIRLLRTIEPKHLGNRKNRVVDVELLTGMKEKIEELNNFKKRLTQSTVTSYNIVEDNINLTEIQKKIALSDSHILIEGPTGVGKEVLAKTLHEESNRKDSKFVALNCAGLSEHLLESELFGHIRGAFTGAFNTKQGIVEEYKNGTLFLDEINSIPLPIQSKLLRFLDSGEYRRLGSNEIKNSKIRIIAASNENIQILVAKGKFREDLYYRLRTYELFIPPLKERIHQVKELIKIIDKDIVFSPKGLALLMHHDYQGNIRELKTILERLKIINNNNNISDKSIREVLNEFSEYKQYSEIDIPENLEGKAFKLVRKILTNAALNQADGNTVVASKILGVSHPSISKWSDEEIE